ncbi:MAG: hypothetical protein OEZ38_13135 [Gammaproteobacteria bacterium]|nr:hypothetical protein [Gammaproteobacteria bacterium]
MQKDISDGFFIYKGGELESIMYLLLIASMIGVYYWAEKLELSGLVWCALQIGFFAVFNDFLHLSPFLSIVLSAAIVIALIQSYLMIEDRYAPDVILFTIFRDFEKEVVNFIYKLIKLVSRFVSKIIVPKYKIINGFGLAEYIILKEAVINKNWKNVDKILSESKNKSLFYYALKDEGYKPEHYLSWLKLDSGNDIALTVYGNSHITAAWESRGSGTADTVSTKQINKFFEHLVHAQEAFLEAIKHNKDNPEPFASLLIVAKGLSLDDDEKWKYFVQMVKRDPLHYFGHLSMIDALNPKWGGSTQAMFGFARTIANNQPGKKLFSALIAMAHIEQWLYLSMSEEDEYEEYFYRPDVVNEIEQNYKINYPELPVQADYVDYYTLNLYAFCFYQMNNVDEARVILNFIKKRGVDYPWIYINAGLLSHFDTSYSFAFVYDEVL